jgi:hypothetical protein
MPHSVIKITDSGTRHLADRGESPGGRDAMEPEGRALTGVGAGVVVTTV